MSIERTAETRWRDPKRYLWAMGLIVPLLAPLAAILAGRFGSVFWWLGPIVVIGVVPLADLLVGVDTANPPESAVAGLEADRWYRLVVYAYLPLQLGGLIHGTRVLASGDLSIIDRIGFATTIGVVAGVGINAAHELGHKRERHERLLSRLALAQSGYGHFHVEHNRGHHLRVATPEDPASSRLGESFWRFLPRTVVGGLRSAWSIESTRLRARGRPVFGPGNEVLVGWALSLALFVPLVVWQGPGVIPYLALQAVVGFCLLEVVNYIEHYGLARRKVRVNVGVKVGVQAGVQAGERYERCRPEHSWNANQRVSNLLLYQLERHSDHHAHPTRRYQALRHFDEAPQLPTGYGGMLVLAGVPPLWRRVMDPLVAAHYGGDLTRANVDPRRRDRYLTTPGSAV